MAETLKEMLIRHEALRLYPYVDSVGKTTIGVGRNLDDKGISKQEALLMLKNDIDDAIQDAIRWLGEDVYYAINEARRMVVINMIFNMGYTRMEGFKKFKTALRNFNYIEAAYEMEDSLWYKQVGIRAKELKQVMIHGELLR